MAENNMYESSMRSMRRAAATKGGNMIVDPQTGVAYARDYRKNKMNNAFSRDNDTVYSNEGYMRAVKANPRANAEQQRLKKLYDGAEGSYRGEAIVKVPHATKEGLFRYARLRKVDGPPLPGDERNTPSYTRYEHLGFDEGWDEYNKAVMAQRFHVSSSAKRAKAARGKTGQSQFVVGTESALGAGGTERAAQQTPSQASTKQSVALRGQRRRIA